MRKKLLDFMQGRFGIFVCIAILFPLLAAVTSSSQYLYAGNSTATVKVLVVGGGGSGGSGVMNAGGGGGGGGGYQENNYFTVVAQAYTVTVGGSNQSSSFSTITANAGGSGGNGGAPGGNGANGGSGGGGAPSGGGGGTGNQGSNGGGSYAPSGGGGGGASTQGSNGVSGSGGTGGNGTVSSISGSSVTYAGGGGGGRYGTNGDGGAGGAGGGGVGRGGGGSGFAGAANTGGGGGGGGDDSGGNGGSGVVIISYVTADFGDCTGGTKTTDGANTVHTFTSSGTFTVVLLTSPTVTTGSTTNVTSSSATLNGTVNANGLSTTAWFNYGIASGTYTGTSTTQSVSGSSNTTVSSDISGLSSNTTYYYRIAASSSSGTSYGSEASFTTSSAPTPTPTPIPPDTTAPSGSVSINSGASYTNSTSVTLTLAATDSVGVVGYYASTSSSTPTASASGWNSVTSATSYSGRVSYSLASGDEQKTVYVWYEDSAGNVSSTASDSIILDTTAPIVTITSPTLSDTYTTTSSPLSIDGSASDTTSGVKEVTWSNDKGGSGTASGTTYWSISSISLTSGDNKITVTAKDNAGNISTDTITVTYNAGSAPTVTTGSATNVTTNSATLSGTVNANGLSTTAWFEYGTVKGSYGNKSSTQTVTGSTDTTVSITITGLTAETTYYYRIAAQNNSGTSYGEEMSFYKDTVENPPTVETEAATDITNTTAKLNGKCNPNGQSTTAWFEYGTLSGTYNYQTSTQSVSGSSYTNISATITGLNVGTKYYYRIVAKNSVGTSYGTEMEFYKSPGTDTTPTPVATPTPKISPAPTLPPLPTPQVSPSPSGEGIVFGFVNDEDAQALEGVTVKIERVLLEASQGQNIPVQTASLSQQEAATIAGAKGSSPYQASTETDENGYYEFSGLDAGEYAITYEKEGYETQTQDISLKEGEVEDLGVVILEQIERGKIYGYAVNIKGNPLEFVRFRLKGVKTKVIKTASSDADGFFEFTDLEADTYVIIAKKKKYRNTQQKVVLEEGESTEIEIVMKKTSKRIKVLLLEEEVQ